MHKTDFNAPEDEIITFHTIILADDLISANSWLPSRLHAHVQKLLMSSQFQISF